MAVYTLTAAQLNNRILNSFAIPSTPSVPTVSDPNAQAFLDAAVITDVTQANAVNSLVIGLKDDGLWTNIQAIYPLVGGTAGSHKYNLKDPRDLDAAYRLAFFGGWTHNTNGITGNGTNTYADTFYNSPKSFGVYSRSATFNTYLTAIQEMVYIGEDFQYENFTKLLASQVYLTNNYISAIVNMNAPYTKLYSITANPIKVYRNGINIATPVQNPTLFNSMNFVLGALRLNTYYDGNLSTNYYDFTTGNIAFAYYSTVILDATQNANLNTRIQTFQTSLGRQV